MHYHQNIRRIVPFLLIIVAVLMFFRTVLFVDGYTLPWDFRGHHLPLATAYADAVAEGVWPLWEPYTYCGRPLLANPQTAVFHPAMFLAVIGGRDGLLERLEWAAILQVILAGWIVLALCRRLGLSDWPATLAAFMFSLGAFTASQAQHWSTLAGMPAIALAWLGLFVAPRWQVPVISAAFALSFLGGYPALTLATAASTLLLAILARQGVRPVLFAALLALTICGAQLLPSIELAQLSIGRFRTDWLNDALDVPPVALVSMVWPNHLSVFDLAHYKSPYQLTSLYLYGSIAGFLLMLAGLWTARRNPWRPIALTALVSMLLMFGERTPLGVALSGVLPDFIRNTVYWHLFLLPFLLSVALLAGLGCSRFPRLAPVLTILVAADCIAVSSNRPMNLANGVSDPLVTADAIDGDKETARALRSATGDGRFDTVEDGPHLSTMAPILRLRAANGYDPLALERLIRFRMTFSDGARWGAYQQVRKLDSGMPAMSGTRALISRQPVDSGAWRLRADLPGRKLYTTGGPARYRMVHKVRSATSMAQAASLLLDDTGVVAEGFALNEQTAPASVRVLAETRQHVVLETESDKPAFLVAAEAYYPGWTARIDGGKAAVYHTNVAFRGVAIPAGKHKVEFLFTSRLLAPGLAGSLAGIALWLALALRARRKPAAAIELQAGT